MQSVVLSKMLPKILSQDSNYDEWCEQEILNAYKDAAKYDDFLFGDYDYESEWLGKRNDDAVQIEEVNSPLFLCQKTKQIKKK